MKGLPAALHERPAQIDAGHDLLVRSWLYLLVDDGVARLGEPAPVFPSGGGLVRETRAVGEGSFHAARLQPWRGRAIVLTAGDCDGAEPVAICRAAVVTVASQRI